MDCLSEALALHDLGCSVIPIRGKKTAAVRWKPFQSTRADQSQLRDWFDSRDDLGIGVVCGSVSDRLMVRDFDRPESFRRWRDANRRVSRTLPSVTTTRGVHVYFRLPDGESTGTTRFDDGELRGDGSYVVAPPSCHPSGKLYQWVKSRPQNIPILPLSETGFLGPLHTRDSRHLFGTEGGVLSGGEWDLDVRRWVPCRKGERHSAIFEFVRKLRVLRPEASFEEAVPLVRQWFQESLPFIGTKRWDVTFRDAKDAWQRIYNLDGSTVLADSLSAAIKRLPPGSDQTQRTTQRTLLLLLCEELATQNNANGCFYLSCRTAGELLGVPYRTANYWLSQLTDDGSMVQLVVRGNRGRGQDASVYRFVGKMAANPHHQSTTATT